MLKKILTFFGALAIVWSVNAIPVMAIDATVGLDDAAGDKGAGYSLTTDLPALIGGIISVLLSLLGVIFLILTIYAGFLWMTAAGDDKKIQSARNILSGAVVGLVIILAAYSITAFVTRSLTLATDQAASPWGSTE